MATEKAHVAVGVFSDRFQADHAVKELHEAGFTKDEIGIVGPHRTDTDDDRGAAIGAAVGAGAVAGAGLGGLVGLGVLTGMIPVIGPIIAGGTLAVILANAAGGAVIGGLVGILVGFGISEEEAQYYEKEVQAGKTVVTVRAGDRYSVAAGILRRHGSYSYAERESVAASCGSTSCAPTAKGAYQTPIATAVETTKGANPAPIAAAADAQHKLQLQEEELHARKEKVKKGEVHVHKEIITEHKTLDVPVQREEVVIERRPVAGQSTSGPIQAGQEIRIPVKEEEVHIEKRPVVKEEVTISKQTVQGTEQVSGTVRKEQVKIEKEGNVNVNDKKNRGRKR
jgi:uncharacterized protein (TIGR02271 family)